MLKAPVHVVMVNLNRPADTVECLESVLRSEYPALHAIVVDNGSTDDSVEQLSAWASGDIPYDLPRDTVLGHLSWPPIAKPVEHIVISPEDHATAVRRGPLPALTIIASSRNEGFAVGNNIALRMVLATGGPGYALLINNDMVVSPGAVTALVEQIESDSSIAATGGVILDYAKPDVVQMVGGGQSTGLGWAKLLGTGLRRDQVPRAANLAFVGGGCLLIRLETLRQVGLLDETFFLYGEDYDWGARMCKQGFRLTYSPRAEVWHKGGLTVVSRSPFQDYHMVRATLGFVRKHKPHLHLIAFGYSVFRSLAPKVVRRQWSRVRAVLAAYADHVRAKPAGPGVH